MDCEVFTSLLSRWPDGELSPGEEQAMREHAASCPECGRMLLAMEEMHRAFQGMNDEVEVPADFAEGWRRQVRAEAFRRKRGRARSLFQGVAAAAAAVVVLLGGTALWRTGRLPIAYPAAPEGAPQILSDAGGQPEEADAVKDAPDEETLPQMPMLSRMAPGQAESGEADMAQGASAQGASIPEPEAAGAEPRAFVQDLASFAGIVLPWALGALAFVGLAGIGVHLIRRNKRKE